MAKNDKQIKSKKRVADHGEVFTSEREVNSMLDLVYNEAKRIESRFLEPACGTGNFLIEIYSRKLHEVEKKYKKSQTDFEKYAFLSTSSIYGIDLMPDNIAECKKRLLDKFSEIYKEIYKSKCKKEFFDVIDYILSKNLLVGDALTLLQEDGNPIIFPEWNFVRGSMVKRRDYIYKELIKEDENSYTEKSIENKKAFIPEPILEFPMVHYMKVVEYEK